ncbi:unnamed protein product [Brassica rapa subsp. narinosa]
MKVESLGFGGIMSPNFHPLSHETGKLQQTISRSIGVDVNKIDKFIGDIKANTENHVFRGEQEAQVGKGSRGDVTILPTIVINNKQPRGERSKDVLLERSMVLKDFCSGFSETTEPHICLNKDIETNECLQNNGGCWDQHYSLQGHFQRKSMSMSCCSRCQVLGEVVAAVQYDHSKGCKCPPGLKGVGLKYTVCESHDS